MKISLRHLDRVIAQMKRECIYSDNNHDDVVVDLSLKEGDPANGQIVTCLALEADASAQSKERNGYIASKAKCELFEIHEKMEPVITIEVAKKLVRN